MCCAIYVLLHAVLFQVSQFVSKCLFSFLFSSMSVKYLEQGADYMTLMAHPWFRASLMDQISSESPSCPNEFTSVTGHLSGPCFSASLHDPQSTRWWWASGGMPGSLASDKLAPDQSAVGLIVNGERGKYWRSKVNSWLSTADSDPCEGGGGRTRVNTGCWSCAWWCLPKNCVKIDWLPFFYTFY